MMSKTPVAFFAFNRPEHAERGLSALARCDERGECSFFFFCDGPRDEWDEAEVAATRAVLERWAPEFGAELRLRERNVGLAVSISAGVSELVGQHGRVIVLEDDLTVAPDFLHFMRAALDHYEDEPSVMQVGGLTLCMPESGEADAFLIPVTTTWGWGTWARAWRHFGMVPKDLEAAWADDEWVARFNLNGAVAFSAMLRDRLAGRNNSWGILWWYVVSRNKGLVVYPRRSLVHNGGFDGSGVHCGAEDFLGHDLQDVIGGQRLGPRIAFPEAVTADESALRALEGFFRGLNGAAPASVEQGSGLRSVAGWVGRRLGFVRA